MNEQKNFIKYVSESRSARGMVWVPTLTQKEVSDKSQYWNKFKITKNDSLFQEVVERFSKKAIDKRAIARDVPTTARSKSCDGRNRNVSSVPRPYPSGSCNRILAGKPHVKLCVKPILNPR